MKLAVDRGYVASQISPPFFAGQHENCEPLTREKHATLPPCTREGEIHIVLPYVGSPSQAYTDQTFRAITHHETPHYPARHDITHQGGGRTLRKHAKTKVNDGRCMWHIFQRMVRTILTVSVCLNATRSQTEMLTLLLRRNNFTASTF